MPRCPLCWHWFEPSCCQISFDCFECLHVCITGRIFDWCCNDAIGGPVVENEDFCSSVKTSYREFPVRSMNIVPFFLSIEIRLQNIWFILYFSIGGFMKFQFQCAWVLWWLFPRWSGLFFYCFIWPLSVAAQLYEKYFCTAEYVRPVHVVTLLLSIDLRRVALLGQNKRLWRYCIKALLDVMV